MEIIVRGSKKYVDKSGERVHFKEPYFDKAFRRTFKSVEEKAHFMNSQGIVSAGDSDAAVNKLRKQVQEQQREKRNG